MRKKGLKSLRQVGKRREGGAREEGKECLAAGKSPALGLYS
jgi:hypothetical protein